MILANKKTKKNHTSILAGELNICVIQKVLSGVTCAVWFV